MLSLRGRGDIGEDNVGLAQAAVLREDRVPAHRGRRLGFWACLAALLLTDRQVEEGVLGVGIYRGLLLEELDHHQCVLTRFPVIPFAHGDAEEPMGEVEPPRSLVRYPHL